MAYDTYEFTFAGRSSASYGMFVADFGSKTQGESRFANDANIVEARIPRRVRPIHYGVKYHEKPLEFTLVFGSERALDRFDLEEISMWLTGYQDYQWLTIGQPDLEHVAFRCIVKSLTPILNGWLPVAFEANIICDCPYAYGMPFEETWSVRGSTTLTFRNETSVREYLKPKFHISMGGGAGVDTVSFCIRNRSDAGREFRFDNLPPNGMDVDVDAETGVITTTGDFNPYDFCNLKFPRFVPGDNIIELEGRATITVSGRKYHNVGS